jgi:hypothetical protein
VTIDAQHSLIACYLQKCAGEDLCHRGKKRQRSAPDKQRLTGITEDQREQLSVFRRQFPAQAVPVSPGH